MAKEVGSWGSQKPAGAPRRGSRSAADIISRRLEPGERLIWSARGRGLPGNRPAPGIADTTDFGVLFCSALLLAFAPIAWRFVEQAPQAAAFIVLMWALMLWSVLPRSLFGYWPMVYGLTNERLIIVNYVFFGVSGSYGHDKIERLLVNNFDGRGDLVFRGVGGDQWMPQSPLSPGDALVGIDDPERVAKLIKSTLELNTPVEIAGRSS